jgi:hypothetical protein
MAEMIAEVYDALKEAGASEDKARQAAVAVTGLRDEPWKRKVEQDITELKSGQRLLQWMVGTNVTITTAILLKLLFV